MSQLDVHLVDQPSEVLFLILKKLDNINVLFSLMGVFNKRFDILLRDNVFTNTLNFVHKSSTNDDICSLNDSILNRFCIDILLKIHHNVQHLTRERMSMGRILLVGNYPNLTSLKLFNFEQEFILTNTENVFVPHFASL